VSGPRVGPVLVVEKPTRRTKQLRTYLEAIREGRFTDEEWARLWDRIEDYRAEAYQHGFTEGSKIY
jgi:hypothetical protein